MQLPEQFCERMRRLLGDAYDAFIASYDAPVRRGVRVNTLKSDIDTVVSAFPATPEHTPFAKDTFYLDTPHKAGADPLFHAGAYYMQEPSASSAVTVLAPQPNEKILDMCAAPGGKSTQIAAALNGTGLLWSNEYVRARARILEQNMERCGVRNAVVSNAAPADLAKHLGGFFDRVLVDAPCSGEGMFRKEPDALSGWNEQAVKMCADRQRDILMRAADTVRAGGVLVYSTCTFAPEENECTVAWFLQNRDDFEPMPIDVTFGRAGFGFETVASFDQTVEQGRYDPRACRRIFLTDGGEGHFIAAFRRTTVAETDNVKPFAYPKNDPNEKAAKALYAELFTDEIYGTPMTVGDMVRLLPAALPDLKGCGVLAAGVAFAQVKKGRLEPAHSAFVAAKAENCRRVASFDATDPLLRAFLHGEEITFDGENGYTAVAAAGAVCGFGKVSGGRLKNRYPKGLRLF
ncbi:MAG: RsmF rRNA methyltransferase first C-terminal domain-containing protein [Clostridia bacterium]|nr:RsmF rRNA methyltransferase first C-terminal domain-containing protein [Clostridia bacterium]